MSPEGFRLELLDQGDRSGRRREQPPLDLLGGVEPEAAPAEGLREPPAAEAAVELLQEPGRAPSPEPYGLPDKRTKLGRDLLAHARRVAVDDSRSTHGLPCAPRPTMTAAAPVVPREPLRVRREMTSPEGGPGHERHELAVS